MIAVVMLSAILAAALAGVAAAAAERSLRLWGRQARWAWVAALAASLALPAAAVLLPRAADVRVEVPATAALRVLPPIVVHGDATLLAALLAALRDAALGALREGAAALAAWDRQIAAAWAVLSLLALLRLARGLRSLRRARRRWVPAELDATPVLLARDAGPLVVGVRTPRVVLPEWALALEPERRAMILRHEVEHARAHDPALLAAAALAVALVPWNAAVWWQLRRLRLAVELDCDARVLRAHPDVTRYGLLLLDVARRVTPPGPALAAALAEPTTDLERRIATMRTKPSRHRVLLSAALAAVAVVATSGAVVACRASEAAPTGTKSLRTAARATDTVTVARTQPVFATVSDERARTDAARAAEKATGYAVRADTGRAVQSDAAARERERVKVVRDGAAAAGEAPYFEFKVTRAATPAPGNVGPRYPEELRAARIEGAVLAQIVVDTNGTMMPGSFKVVRSDGVAFTKAVREALDGMRFLPAEVDGRKVRQLLELPFQFSLSK